MYFQSLIGSMAGDFHHPRGRGAGQESMVQTWVAVNGGVSGTALSPLPLSSINSPASSGGYLDIKFGEVAGSGGGLQAEKKRRRMSSSEKLSMSLGGAPTFWIYNTGPIGCMAFIIKYFPPAPNTTDKIGCVKSYNEMAQDFNKQLKDKNKALDALAIEDKKRQYNAAEKYLEDVLQLATSED